MGLLDKLFGRKRGTPKVEPRQDLKKSPDPKTAAFSLTETERQKQEAEALSKDFGRIKDKLSDPSWDKLKTGVQQLNEDIADLKTWGQKTLSDYERMGQEAAELKALLESDQQELGKQKQELDRLLEEFLSLKGSFMEKLRKSNLSQSELTDLKARAGALRARYRSLTGEDYDIWAELLTLKP